MRKIIGYEVVEDSAPSYISEHIQRLIGDGWEPRGHLCVRGVNHFVQVMVKYEEEA